MKRGSGKTLGRDKNGGLRSAAVCRGSGDAPRKALVYVTSPSPGRRGTALSRESANGMCMALPLPRRILTTQGARIKHCVDAARGQMDVEIAARRPTRCGNVSIPLQPTTWRRVDGRQRARVRARVRRARARRTKARSGLFTFWQCFGHSQKSNTYVGILPNENVPSRLNGLLGGR